MSKKTGLGRGLGAYFPASESQEEESGLRMLPINRIKPNPHQPRGKIDKEKLAELAASIKEHGLIQPLIVTQERDTFVLIAGERRWRAAKLAQERVVPAIVKEATPQAMLELAIIENIQRADLNPLEEAFAYQQLSDDFGLTHEQVAKRVGKGRSTITNLIRLLELPESIQQAVTDGRISGAHARALLPLSTTEMRTNAMNRIIRLHLSVRQTESLVKKWLATEKPDPEPKQKKLSPELAALQSEFEQSLGTKVNIQKGSKGGKVMIHFYSDEELQAIYDAIVGKE